jgi:hypothetical protein
VDSGPALRPEHAAGSTSIRLRHGNGLECVQMSGLRNSDSRYQGHVLAGKRLIGRPIPDIQHANPRGVGKGRLLDPELPSTTVCFRARCGV